MIKALECFGRWWYGGLLGVLVIGLSVGAYFGFHTMNTFTANQVAAQLYFSVLVGYAVYCVAGPMLIAGVLGWESVEFTKPVDYFTFVLLFFYSYAAWGISVLLRLVEGFALGGYDPSRIIFFGPLVLLVALIGPFGLILVYRYAKSGFAQKPAERVVKPQGE